MSILSVHIKVICSAVDDVDLICDAMVKLLHDDAELSVSSSKTYHGAIQFTIEAMATRKRDVRQLTGNLPKSMLTEILEEGLEKMMDDNKTLHFRLDLQEFVKGRVVLGKGIRANHPVKIRMKIESYPGQDPLQVAEEYFSGLGS